MNKINPVKYTLVVLLTLSGVYVNADDYKMGGKTYQDLVETSKKNTEELKKFVEELKEKERIRKQHLQQYDTKYNAKVPLSPNAANAIKLGKNPKTPIGNAANIPKPDPNTPSAVNTQENNETISEQYDIKYNAKVPLSPNAANAIKLGKNPKTPIGNAANIPKPDPNTPSAVNTQEYNAKIKEQYNARVREREKNRSQRLKEAEAKVKEEEKIRKQRLKEAEAKVKEEEKIRKQRLKEAEAKVKEEEKIRKQRLKEAEAKVKEEEKIRKQRLKEAEAKVKEEEKIRKQRLKEAEAKVKEEEKNRKQRLKEAEAKVKEEEKIRKQRLKEAEAKVKEEEKIRKQRLKEAEAKMGSNLESDKKGLASDKAKYNQQLSDAKKQLARAKEKKRITEINYKKAEQAYDARHKQLLAQVRVGKLGMSGYEDAIREFRSKRQETYHAFLDATLAVRTQQRNIRHYQKIIQQLESNVRN